MTVETNAEAKAPVSETVAETPVSAVTETKAAETEAPEGEKTEAETTETPVEGAEVVETEEEKKTKSKLRRERDKAKIAAAEARAVAAEEKLAALERSKPAAETLAPMPKREDYEDDALFQADLAAYRVEERIIARQNKAHETATTTTRSDNAAAKAELFKERAMALKESYPDIERIFSQEALPVSASMADTIMESDKGPEVAHYLLRHPEEFQRIKEMSQTSAARAIGRIEAALSLPKPRTETKAPPPPATLSGTVKGPAKNPENMSHEEYVRWRDNGGGQRR